ncbi:MAG: undecaprenyl-phosphate galactose phosphotransferase WbaP [Synergistetes bacterium]|nr:undecaprenyl-phosphate galactose phosphotransferase WbaP [Synergistota bacterium]
MRQKVKGKLGLFVFDLLVFYIVLFVAFLLRVYVFPLYFEDLPAAGSYILRNYLRMWWVPVLFVLFVAIEGLYTRRLYFWDEFAKLWKVSAMFVVVVFSIVALGKMSSQVSRLTILAMFFLLLLFFPLIRYYGKMFLISRNVWVESALIMGAGRAGRRLLLGLKREKVMGYRVVGFLDDNVKESVEGVPVLGGLKDIKHVIDNTGAKVVFIAIPSLGLDNVRKLYEEVSEIAPDVYVVPEMGGIPTLNSELHYFFYEGLFVIHTKNKLFSVWRKRAKRLFDVGLVALTLPVTLPLLGVLSLLIVLDSRGGAFFIHERVGENGKKFGCIKLRTMYKDAPERLKELLDSNPDIRKEWETSFKLKDDPRVTRIGNFLRKTSLDELPQIFNVLKGDMSLVGPRPVVQEEIEKYYREKAAFYFKVKPGITGLWQVSGRSDADYNFRIALDVWYTLNWSLWLDFVIILKTVAVVIKKEGAY